MIIIGDEGTWLAGRGLGRLLLAHVLELLYGEADVL
jgi:hypothetical protein